MGKMTKDIKHKLRVKNVFPEEFESKDKKQLLLLPEYCYYKYMSKSSLKIKVEPAILKYARYYSGFEIVEVAKKTKIKAESLTLFESEKSDISLSQLERLANVYKMPLAYFFLQNIPKDVVLPKDFRIIYSAEDTKLSPVVLLAIRRARYVQSIIQELVQEEIEYPFQRVSTNDDVEVAASKFRSLLDIGIDEQNKWQSGSVALRKWKEAVERLQIFVLQQSLPKDDVSAFCLADQKPFVITLNSSEHENRRIFSLFHEIGHILLNHSGICTPDDLSRNSYQYIQIEKFCNQFAASILVPKDAFLKDSHVQRIMKLSVDQWQDDDIKAICARFRVSQEVIYRRFVTTGTISEQIYEKKRNELIKGFEEFNKSKKKGEVRIPQYRKIISQNGYAYSSLVLENLHSNRITMADAAEFLNTNTKHVPAVEYHF